MKAHVSRVAQWLESSANEVCVVNVSRVFLCGLLFRDMQLLRRRDLNFSRIIICIFLSNKRNLHQLVPCLIYSLKVCLQSGGGIVNDIALFRLPHHFLVLNVHPHLCSFFSGSGESRISELPPEDAVCLLTTNSPVNLLCFCHYHCHTGNPAYLGWSCRCLHR